jgi:menaquinone-dependent protoporphyrinogen oxidase
MDTTAPDHVAAAGTQSTSGRADVTPRRSKILVAYASSRGSTREIADVIGFTLADAGAAAQTASVTDDPDPALFDAVVLGSAIHNGAFLPEFQEYVERHRTALRRQPTWLFSVGMGPALRGPIGAIFRPMVPKPIAAIRDTLQAIEYHPFAGVFDRPPELRLRIIIRLMGARYGDNRDWHDIEAWSASIAKQARATFESSQQRHREEDSQ